MICENLLPPDAPIPAFPHGGEDTRGFFFGISCPTGGGGPNRSRCERTEGECGNLLPIATRVTILASGRRLPRRLTASSQRLCVGFFFLNDFLKLMAMPFGGRCRLKNHFFKPLLPNKLKCIISQL